ncbi:hypothetical protein BTVI_58666 [Pitangus sulphuratus]|nr:hypothetical protein BTVI_58666 [Pitangus sulphuratus]
MRYPFPGAEAREFGEWKKHIIGPLFVNALLQLQRGISAPGVALEGRRCCNHLPRSSQISCIDPYCIGDILTKISDAGNGVRCCLALVHSVDTDKAEKQEYSRGRTKVILADFPVQLNPGPTENLLRKPGDSQHNPELSEGLSTRNKNGKVEDSSSNASAVKPIFPTSTWGIKAVQLSSHVC